MMNEEKRRFKTIIAGRPYTILANKPEQHLRTVSEIANDKISQIKAAIPELDIEQRSVLIAVNAISDAITKQAEINELKQRISELENGSTTMNKNAKEKEIAVHRSDMKKVTQPVNTNSRSISKNRAVAKRSKTTGMPYASKEKLLNKSAEIEKR